MLLNLVSGTEGLNDKTSMACTRLILCGTSRILGYIQETVLLVRRLIKPKKQIQEGTSEASYFQSPWILSYFLLMGVF